MGGNYGGSITFTTEHSRQKYRGLVGSFTVTSCLMGLMLGSATATLFSSILSDAEMESWGWRLPFLAGILICIVGYYLRRRVAESPLYEQAQQEGQLSQSPIKEVFTNYAGNLFTLVLVVMLHDLSFYILFVYMTTHLTEFLHLSKSVAFTINTVNMLFVSLVTMGSAWLSDLYGRKIVMGSAAVLFIIGTLPLMTIINQSDQALYIFLAQMLMAIGVGGYFGPLPALMVETFPTAVRNSAVSLTTNISGPLFGGTAPQVVILLITYTGSNLVPGYYLTAGAVVALLALLRLKAIYRD
jgi:MHS family proline/betaine transporter-like MFS transporter